MTEHQGPKYWEINYSVEYEDTMYHGSSVTWGESMSESGARSIAWLDMGPSLGIMDRNVGPSPDDLRIDYREITDTDEDGQSKSEMHHYEKYVKEVNEQ